VSEVINWIKTDRPRWYQNKVIFTRLSIDYHNSDNDPIGDWKEFTNNNFDAAIMSLDWWELTKDPNTENYGVYVQADYYPPVNGDKDFFRFSVTNDSQRGPWLLKVKELTEYLNRVYAHPDKLPNTMTLNFWVQNTDQDLDYEMVFTILNLATKGE
jgi:hypothetical protein